VTDVAGISRLIIAPRYGFTVGCAQSASPISLPKHGPSPYDFTNINIFHISNTVIAIFVFYILLYLENDKSPRGCVVKILHNGVHEVRSRFGRKIPCFPQSRIPVVYEFFLFRGKGRPDPTDLVKILIFTVTLKRSADIIAEYVPVYLEFCRPSRQIYWNLVDPLVGRDHWLMHRLPPTLDFF